MALIIVRHQKSPKVAGATDLTRGISEEAKAHARETSSGIIQPFQRKGVGLVGISSGMQRSTESLEAGFSGIDIIIRPELATYHGELISDEKLLEGLSVDKAPYEGPEGVISILTGRMNAGEDHTQIYGREQENASLGYFVVLNDLAEGVLSDASDHVASVHGHPEKTHLLTLAERLDTADERLLKQIILYSGGTQKGELVCSYEARDDDFALTVHGAEFSVPTATITELAKEFDSELHEAMKETSTIKYT